MSDDGTEAERLKAELAAVRGEYEYFLYFMPALLEADVQTARVTYMNRMARILLGYDEAEIEAGIDGLGLLDDAGVKMVLDLRDRHLGASKAVNRRYEHTPTQDLYEASLRRKDGTWFPAEAQGSYLVDDQGHPVRIRFLIRDVSRRKAAEEALANSERRLRTLAENAPVILLQIDRDGQIVVAEGKGLREFNLQPGQLVGLPIAAAAPKGTRLGAIYDRARSGEPVAERIQVADRILDVRAEPLRTASGEYDGFVAVATDMTDLDTAGRALAKSQKMESLGILAGGIAHDFNNVLSTILSVASALRRSPALGEEEREHLQTIDLAARRGADVAGRVLAFARGGPATLAPADLREVIADVENLAMPSIRRTVSIQTHVPPMPVVTGCDRGQLTQALLNVVLNARDAMPGGGEVHLAVDAVGARAVITVSDNGPGMDEQTLAQIFQPFFTTKPPGQGTGLGLAVVQGIIASHRGTISVQSAPGEGATFIVSLPLVQGEGGQLAAGEGATVAKLPTSKSGEETGAS